MQTAIPFKSFYPAGAAILLTNGDSNGVENYVRELVSENPIVVIGRQGCCMSHVVKRLLLGLGVNPPVFEVEEKDEGEVVKELGRVHGGDCLPFPVVFVGGKMFGGLDRVIATHISGELVPILKDAGVLWL